MTSFNKILPRLTSLLRHAEKNSPTLIYGCEASAISFLIFTPLIGLEGIVFFAPIAFIIGGVGGTYPVI